MTSRHTIKKWMYYLMGLLPLWMLDCYILTRYPVSGVNALLLPLAVTAVAMLEGRLAGGIFGLWVGFLWVTTYPVSMVTMIFFMTLFGFCAGAWVESGLQKGFVGFVICTTAMLTAVECIILGSALQQGLGDMMLRVPLAGKQILYTLCYTPVVYLVFQTVFHKVGGNRLA